MAGILRYFLASFLQPRPELAQKEEVISEQRRMIEELERENRKLKALYWTWETALSKWSLGDPLAPTNVATRKYQIWVSLFPGGNFLAKFSYKFLHRWSCTQTAQIALEYYSHTLEVNLLMIFLELSLKKTSRMTKSDIWGWQHLGGPKDLLNPTVEVSSVVLTPCSSLFSRV